MNVVIDYGNSAAKVGIFDHQNLTDKLVFQSAELLTQFLRQRTFEHAIISSVNAEAEAFMRDANVKGMKMLLTHNIPLPVNILYKTPATLGVDRIAGVCGAHQLFPGMNSLVIDAGTCITFDFLDQNSSYHGGAISPGLNMRFKAMNTFTARLPLISAAGTAELIGDSTENSIRSGVVNGMIAEIDGIISRYQQKFPDLKVILCGGDAVFFENKLKASIFAIPELVLTGLNSILIHNVTL
jgi:type III pantothenate kinase